MYVLGLTGAKQCGKTALAHFLVNQHGFTRMRLADTMKEMLKTLGLTHEQVDGDEKEVPCALLAGGTPRHAMQTLGTEWGRECMGQDLWASILRERILQQVALNPYVKIVIDDIRFPNEAEMVMQMAGEVWRVRRPAVEPKLGVWSALRFALGVPGGHASEVHWRTLPAKRELWNEGTLDDLFFTAEIGLPWVGRL